MSTERRLTGTRPTVRWPAIAVGAWVGCALFLTLVPSRPRHLFPGLNDTAGHLLLGVLLGGSLSCLARALLPQRRIWGRPALATGAVGASILIGTEMLQSVTATRSPQLLDALADALGTALIVMVLAFAFEAGLPLADRTSGGFVALAIASALVVVVTAIASPYEPPRTTWPVTGAVACVPRYQTETAASAVLATAPLPEPLVAFDLADDATRSTLGSLDPIDLSAVGDVFVRPGVGIALGGSGDALRAVTPPGELVRSIVEAQAFTVEAWIRPADVDQQGPSRIVTVSNGAGRGDVDIHLGLERDQLSVRLRTACGPLWFLAGELDAGASHVAATFDHGHLAIFVDGGRVASADLDDADLDVWDPSYDLVIGNEATLDRGYRGTVALVAFYQEAFTPEQVARLAAAPAPCVALNSDDAGG